MAERKDWTMRKTIKQKFEHTAAEALQKIEAKLDDLLNELHRLMNLKEIDIQRALLDIHGRTSVILKIAITRDFALIDELVRIVDEG